MQNRYCRDPGAKPLWPMSSGRPSKDDLPKCSYCNGPLHFEFQVWIICVSTTALAYCLKSVHGPFFRIVLPMHLYGRNKTYSFLVIILNYLFTRT